MALIVLDLEWNTAYFTSKKGFANEIIEFGAVKLNDALEEIDSFSTLINPGKKHLLRTNVKKITNLSNEELRKNGIPFCDAVKQFADWSKDCIIGTWSKSDVYALIENFRIFCGIDRIPFLSRYIDLQEYVQKSINPNCARQISLHSAADSFNVKYSVEQLHRALNDSRITADILRLCFDRQRFDRLSLVADEAFYERLFFKPYIIKDIKSRYIDERDLNFNCEVCRGKLKKKTRWQYKDKAFNAYFNCKSCDVDYVGKVQVKKTYDSIQVKKTLCKSSSVPTKKSQTRKVVVKVEE